MKPFARINLSSVALRRGILVSSLALAGKNGSVATKNAKDKALSRFGVPVFFADPVDIAISVSHNFFGTPLTAAEKM